MKLVENSNKKNRWCKQQLPDEIVLYILSYVPVSSMFKIRSVCKQWNTLFLNPLFLYFRMINSTFVDLEEGAAIMLRKIRMGKPVGDFFEFTKVCLNSQGSLHLETYHSPLRYRIQCRPLCQYLNIPNPQYPSLCIAMDFVNNHAGPVFKLLSVHEDKENNSLGYEILALGIGADQSAYCWRAVDKVPNTTQGSRNNGMRKSTQLFFRMGAVAYCVWFVELNNDDLDIQVDILDMVSESYIGHTTFPRGFFDTKLSTNLVDWNGRLSFAQLVKEELHVLVLDDYSKLKWAERKQIIKLPFLKPDNEELLTFYACAAKSYLFFARQDKDKKFLCRYGTITRVLNTSELPNPCLPEEPPCNPGQLVAMEVALLMFLHGTHVGINGVGHYKGRELLI